MVKYLGELDDDDLIMFVIEHLKDHKGAQKLVEGLEPVRIAARFVGPRLTRSAGFRRGCC